MKVAVLGTGMVGKTIGSKLVQLGHEVKMGSRQANNTKATDWVSSAGMGASQGTFEDAAAFGEIVFNCTGGMVSLSALQQAGAANLKGKVIVDISNPLDFSKGAPPTLAVCNTDSVAEQLQREFPEAKVVKTLNTLNCILMVNPGNLADGEHDIFVAGNDKQAKEDVKKILTSFGWKEKNILDVGDITAARGLEMVLPLWLRLYGVVGSPNFQFKVVR